MKIVFSSIILTAFSFSQHWRKTVHAVCCCVLVQLPKHCPQAATNTFSSYHARADDVLALCRRHSSPISGSQPNNQAYNHKFACDAVRLRGAPCWTEQCVQQIMQRFTWGSTRHVAYGDQCPPNSVVPIKIYFKHTIKIVPH